MAKRVFWKSPKNIQKSREVKRESALGNCPFERGGRPVGGERHKSRKVYFRHPFKKQKRALYTPQKHESLEKRKKGGEPDLPTRADFGFRAMREGGKKKGQPIWPHSLG